MLELEEIAKLAHVRDLSVAKPNDQEIDPGLLGNLRTVEQH